MHKDKIVKQLTKDFLDNMKKEGITDPIEVSKLMRQLFDQITQNVLSNKEEPTAHISAPNAVVEVVDRDSGLLYRRYLELEYDENNNGLRLSGESMSGDPSQITFLSEDAIRKLAELKGEGPNEPKCNNH